MGRRLSRAQAVVQVPRLFRDPKVGKDVRRRTKMWAHDEFNLCALGDIVRTKSARPGCTVARDRGAALRHARAPPVSCVIVPCACNRSGWSPRVR
jgi:hypothetical protein